MQRECAWCHNALSDEAERMVPPLLDALDERRRRYIADTWGIVPPALCARDFLELLSQTNLATFNVPPAAPLFELA